MDYDILGSLTIGQLRELIAYVDADMEVEYFWDNCVDEEDLERIGYDPYEDEEEYCDEDDDSYEDDEEDEFEDEWEEELDDDELSCSYGDTALDNPEEEELAQSIAADINAGRYTYDIIYGVYPEHIVKRVEELA